MRAEFNATIYGYPFTFPDNFAHGGNYIPDFSAIDAIFDIILYDIFVFPINFTYRDAVMVMILILVQTNPPVISILEGGISNA